MIITGVSGLLGSNLEYYFMDKYNISGLYNSHPVIVHILQKRSDIMENSNNKLYLYEALELRAEYNEILYTESVKKLNEARLDFQDLNRKLRLSSFQKMVDFQDE